MVPLHRSPWRHYLQGESVFLPFLQFKSCLLCDDQDEVFALCFRFDPTYPIQAPAVTFVVDDKYSAPVHPVCYIVQL